MAQNPEELKKRSVTISGHRTSVSVENIFWQKLRAIAKSKSLSLNQLITGIDGERVGNLSSAIRVYVVNFGANDS